MTRSKVRFDGSFLGEVWQRLSDVDFITKGMLFAAILLLCFIPFLIVAESIAGRSAVPVIVRHLGLNHQAAQDVGKVFTSPSATSAQLSASSYVLFILGGIAAATAVQELYERVFSVEGRGMKDMWRRLAWLVLAVAAGSFAGFSGKWVRDHGGVALLIVYAIVLLVPLWWFSMWFLLGGRVGWRKLLPGAVATGLFWLGMEIVFSLVYSNTVIHDYEKYGAIGVVTAMMSYLIAIAVVILLGAIVGQVWNARRHPAAKESLSLAQPERNH